MRSKPCCCFSDVWCPSGGRGCDAAHIEKNALGPYRPETIRNFNLTNRFLGTRIVYEMKPHLFISKVIGSTTFKLSTIYLLDVGPARVGCPPIVG